MTGTGLDPSAAIDGLIGRSFGEFVVEGRLGHGGFGTVYRARQPLLDREAVIKVLHPRHLQSEAITQRFLREARLASRLDHPYAAHIYAFGAEQDGLLWIAMELVRGTPLDRLLLAQGPLSLARLVPLLERLCEVIQTAHDQGIVHRDVKPANLMVLSRAGRLLPKLIDFGIAKAALGADPPRPPAARPRPEPGHDAALAQTLSLDAGADAGADADADADADTDADTAIDSQALTGAGAMIGSPHYMAPEQWEDPAAADARADLYALGVLAFEALTARLPFDGPTIRAIALAHAHHPVPALGPGFPPALDAFFARALAKAPASRFGGALELAAALRAASGLQDAELSLPRIREARRDEVMAAWPHPIAEALVAYEAARNVHQARDAMWQLLESLVRWLAIVAAASRSRVGQREPDSPRVIDSIRTLFRTGLSGREWLALAVELTRPWASQPAAHPMPELVQLLHGEGPLAALESLVAERELQTSMTRDDAALRDLLSRCVADLEILIGHAGFLAAYTLVVGRGDAAEQWSGIRRHRAISVRVRGRPLDEGEVVLLDADGAPALSLRPLVQIAAPSPGAAEEMFLVDGRGRLGVRMVSPPMGFERQDESAQEWFRAQFSQVLAHGVESSVQERAPYPGLAAFGPDDAALFFGRERLAEEMVNRLTVQPLLLVVGPSGAGKSSFVHAGVVPALRGRRKVASIRPGAEPVAALEAALADAGVELLVIDQMEELFTLCHDPAEREEFARRVVRFARSASEPTRVIATLRDDFLVRAERLAPLRGRLGPALQLITTPAPDELLRILTEPASRVGFDFEDPGLPAEMVAAVAELPAALPLLAFTAARLWEQRDRHFRRLTRKAYETVGGVGGALARHAEETLSAMTGEEQRLTREAFRHLVTSERTRAVATRLELTQLLGGGDSALAVIDRLIDARLLVSSEGTGGADRVEIAHEALLSAWPRIQNWMSEDVEGARLREQLRTAARQWSERARPRGLLWRDEALAELIIWRRRHPDPLTDLEESFAGASRADSARRTRTRRALLAVAFLALSAALLVFLNLSRREKAQRLRAARETMRAESLLVTSWEDQGSRLLLAGDSLSGLVFLNEALARGRDTDAIRYGLARSLRTLEAERGVLAEHRGPVWTVSVSPDGAWLASGGEDGRVAVWDLARRVRRHQLVHGAVVRASAFVADGRLATGGDDGAIRLWNLATGQLERTLAAHAGPIQEIRADRSGQRLLSTGQDHTVKVWRVDTGTPELTFAGDGRAIGGDFAPDGDRVVVATGDLAGEIKSLGDERTIARLSDPGRGVAAGAFGLFLRFSPRGDRILGVGWNAPARLWDAASGRLVATLDGTRGNRNYGEFSADGRLVVTTGSEQTAKIWDAESGALRATLRGHTGAVNVLAFVGSGERIASGAMDGVVRLWDTGTGVPLATHAGHDRPVFALTSWGTTIASGGWDGTVRLIESSSGDLVSLGEVSPAGVLAAAYAPDGTQLAIATGDGRALLLDARSGRAVGAPQPHQAGEIAIAFAPDGRSWASGGAEGDVLVSRGDGPPATLAAGGAPVNWLEYHPGGGFLLVKRGDDSTEVWDLAARKPAAVRAGSPNASPGRAHFQPGGRRVFTYSSESPEPPGLWDWRADRFQAVAIEGSIYDAAIAHDGRIAIASADRITVLDADGGEVTRVDIPGAIPLQVSFSPGGDQIAAACADSLVRVIDPGRGQLRGLLAGHAATVSWSDFVPGTSLIASTSGDGTVRIWNGDSFAPLAVLRGHSGPVVAAALAPDGASLASFGMDGRVAIWNLSRDTRPAGEVAEWVRCQVPRQLEGGRIVSRRPPADCH